MTGPWPRWYRPPVTVRSVIAPAATAIAAAAAYTGLTTETITGAVRLPIVSQARWAVMMSLRRRGWSTPRIGSVLGDRDHTTIMYGLKRAAALYDTNPGFRKLCHSVEARL